MSPRSLACACAGMLLALIVCAAPGEAQGPPPVTPQFLNEHCVVSVLNRNVRANQDGTWVLPNVPANFGPLRARATCVIDGRTVSGESEPFTVPANGAVNIPPIHFGQTTPIPTALTITAPTTTLTTIGASVQLIVNARYPDGSITDVTANPFVTYTVSNSAIASLSAGGLVQAVASGTVLVQATLEGANGMAAVRVALAGRDTDDDGIPDEVEVALGMNPNNPIDAMEDFDRDDLSNVDEHRQGTNLRDADSDDDLLSDGREVARGTMPLIRDTDGDGIGDGLEVQAATDPLDPASFNLAAALSSLAVTPSIFNVTFNTIAGDAWVQLQVKGTLRDGATLDLTSTERGTNYSSNDLTICSLGATPGRVFAGVSGGCAVTAAVGGFSDVAAGTVTTFAPTPLSFVDLGGPGNGVDVAGDFVYVAAGTAGLKVVDVTNRSAPRVALTLALLGTANDVKLAGTNAFVAAGAAGLHVVDVSNPLGPQRLGSVDTPGTATDVRVRGNLAFVADGPAGLQVVDVTNPAVPRIVGSVATGPTANGVDVEDSIAVVAAGTAGVRIVNVANPASPIVVGAVDTPGEAHDVVVRSGFAFVADWTGSLRAVDFRMPTAPVLGGTTTQALGGILLDVAQMDTFVFGADVFFVNGVPIVEVSDASNLRPRAILNFPGDATGLGIAADGSYLYLGTDTLRLYIGQYRAQQDLNGVPPSVTISAPVNGSTFVEVETFPVTVTATDDLAVTGVTLIVNGASVATDTTAPYQFNVTAPVGAVAVTLRAVAGDLGNNIGVAADVVVNVIPDPLTSATGRVVLQNGTAVAGATVSCLGQSALSLADGTFEVAGVGTVQPTFACVVILVDGNLTQRGVSATVTPVRGGSTPVGDVVLAPGPIISSIDPNVIDSELPPASLQVTGSNLTGAAFSFVPALAPAAITAGAATVNAGGTVATLPIMVAPTTWGQFTLVGTNSSGGADTTPTDGNTVTVINSEVDSDGDGFIDGLELLFGSDPLLATSMPTLTDQGTVRSPAVSVDK